MTNSYVLAFFSSVEKISLKYEKGGMREKAREREDKWEGRGMMEPKRGEKRGIHDKEEEIK